MAKLEWGGWNEYADQLRTLENKTSFVAERVLYEMAGYLYREIRRNLEALPTITDNMGKGRYKQNKPFEALTVAQKNGLLNSLGIAPFRDEISNINTRIGFDGYNEVKTKKYPNGQPNVLIARSLEVGTSWLPKHPFIKPAVNAAKSQLDNIARTTCDKEIAKLTK